MRGGVLPTYRDLRGSAGEDPRGRAPALPLDPAQPPEGGADLGSEARPAGLSAEGCRQGPTSGPRFTLHPVERGLQAPGAASAPEAEVLAVGPGSGSGRGAEVCSGGPSSRHCAGRFTV